MTHENNAGRPSIRFLARTVLVMTTLSVVAASAQTDELTGTAEPCTQQGTWLQVLGSGGPEADDGRSSAGYLVWNNGKARVLIDIGPGSLLRFDQSGARIEDLDVILISHWHVDHSADLPGLVKAAWFTDRQQDLPLLGPDGNDFAPPTTEAIDSLIGPESAYCYLDDFLDGSGRFRLEVQNFTATGAALQTVQISDDLQVTAIPVHHGPLPALAWRVQIGTRALVFSGDMSGRNQTLPLLAKDADLLVAHNAVPEGTTGKALNLHMTPSTIGEIAAQANVAQLVLSHRMNRTLGQEQQTRTAIAARYAGPINFANDSDCFRP